MLVCLCKTHLRVEGVTHLQKKKLEIRSVIKYFCNEGIPSDEIHEDFMETLEESEFYSTV